MNHGYSRPLDILEILEAPKRSQDILDKISQHRPQVFQSFRIFRDFRTQNNRLIFYTKSTLEYFRTLEHLKILEAPKGSFDILLHQGFQRFQNPQKTLHILELQNFQTHNMDHIEYFEILEPPKRLSDVLDKKYSRI